MQERHYDIQCVEIFINQVMDARLINLATKEDIEELRGDKYLKKDSRQLHEELG